MILLDLQVMPQSPAGADLVDTLVKIRHLAKLLDELLHGSANRHTRGLHTAIWVWAEKNKGTYRQASARPQKRPKHPSVRAEPPEPARD